LGIRQCWIEGYNKESMKEREYIEGSEAPQKFDAVMPGAPLIRVLCE